MQFYCEIKVLPDPEASAPVLINNLMSKLHRQLVEQKRCDIGVSFPGYGKTLGEVIRLHGPENSLDALMETNWLKGLGDYCLVSNCQPVPSKIKHRCFYRVQAKSAANKRKRSVAKGWLTQEQAEQQITEDQQKLLKLPFVQLKSNSTGQLMKVFIQQTELLNEPKLGKFNSYGLSKTASIPWF